LRRFNTFDQRAGIGATQGVKIHLGATGTKGGEAAASELIQMSHSGLQVSFFIEKFLYEWRHHSLNGIGRRAVCADKDAEQFITIAASDRVTASAAHWLRWFHCPKLYYDKQGRRAG
jgi:hypothetical protein